MAPIISPPLSSSSSSLATTSTSSITRQLSSSSVQSLAIFAASSSRTNSVEVVREEGLRHAKIKLDASCKELHVPSWSRAEIPPEDVIIHKVSGALTNAVFFVSCPAIPSTRTLLLRIYGSSSGSLISRPRELHILHILSSIYKIGPRVYGTFENGRIEEYFDSVTLTHSDIRDPQISRWIGARMAELHSVDISVVDGPSSQYLTEGNGFQIAANVKSWLLPAEEVLKLHCVPDEIRKELDLPKFRDEWKGYLTWVLTQGSGFGSKRVFAHNDAQYGNLLRLRDGSEGVDEHRQIIVVDFEYAAPNPAAYDIANHFQEWTANYHCPTPHLLSPPCYPTFEERRNFYISYIHHSAMLAEDPVLDESALDDLIQNLDRDVLLWTAASHAGWAIWGIVQAREDLEGNVTEPEFDYIGYARGRMSAFRKAIKDTAIDL